MLSKKTKSKTKSKPSIISKSSPMNEEMKWRAQSDARTLKDAIEIKKDPKRLLAAQKHVNMEISAMREVSKMKPK